VSLEPGWRVRCGVYLLGPFGAFRSGPSAPSARAARGGGLSRMVPQQCRT